MEAGLSHSHLLLCHFHRKHPFFFCKFCPQPFSFYHFGADVNFSAANADVDFGANKGMPRVDFGLNTYNSTGLARIKLVFTE